ncbi:B12-binding domain-containing radical SAM protein [Thermodesulfobacteriota bacterium]
MKILLVRPISNTYIISPPLGLGYIATALRKINVEPYILDCVKEGVSLKEFEGFLDKYNPEIVGFQVWSCDVYPVKESLKIVKKLNKNVVTIVGGAHPSGELQRSLEYFKEADFGFRGEGEEGVALLVKKLSGDDSIQFDSIPGLIWRDDGKIKLNSPVFVDNLDSLGIPAWDLMPPADYPEAPHQGFAKEFPIAPIITTRGCPFNCSFCASHTINGRKVRFRTLDHVLEEISLLRNEYGVKEIHIEDDNFTINKKFVQQFCRALIKNGNNIFWHCSSGIRVDSLDVDTFRLMKRSGCYTFTVAIESGSNRVLQLMQKQLTVETVRKQVAMMNRAGCKPTGLFMIGFPGEKRQEIEETIKFAKSLNLKRAQFAIFHPMPGSRIYDELKNQGRLNCLDWSKIKPSEVAYATEIPEKELKRLQRKAFLSFHLRPRILICQLMEINSWKHFWYLLKRVFSMLF